MFRPIHHAITTKKYTHIYNGLCIEEYNFTFFVLLISA